MNFKIRNIYAKSKDLNMGKKSTHTRFDKDGNDIPMKPCRTLNKVKHFLGKITTEMQHDIDIDDEEVMDIFSVKKLIGETESEIISDVNADLVKQVHLDASEQIIRGLAKSVVGVQLPNQNEPEDANLEKAADNSQVWSMNIDQNPSFNFSENISDSSKPHEHARENTDMFHFGAEHKEKSDDSEMICNREAVEYDLALWDDSVETVDKEGNEVDNSDRGSKKKRLKLRRRRKVGAEMPVEIGKDPELRKYWGQRYRLFSKFDEGVKLDRGSYC